MSITSYSQNFEDVMLWRALGHVPNGFYIDVGAQHPVVDSVSKAFYENGWRGVHVEATPAYASLLRQDRPDETVIQAAVNNKHGTITFFEIPETGISTGDSDIAESHKARGFDVLEITVPCITLLDVFNYADSKDIHWLKVDVEGMERKVLQSWGNSKTRPWIVIIESTLPLTQIENHQNWENLLLDRGYVHVYFDGLNRYYLSPDQRQLASAFLSGPNVFDGFTLHGSASAPFCAAVNEKHGQAEQALQQQVALLNQEKIDLLQHLDAALAEISVQLRTSQDEEQKSKAALAEDSLKRTIQEREWRGEIEILNAQQRQANQESEQRERTIAGKLKLASVKAMQESAELARALAQERHALQNQHADREQTLLNRLQGEQERYRQLQHEASKQVDTLHAQSSQKQQEIENLLRTQLQREQAITEKLEVVRAQGAQESTKLARTHAAQQSELHHKYAAQEQALRQRLEAEQAHRLQLHQDNSAREQALHEQVRLARQATENLLQSQVARERDAAAQLLALQRKSTQENTELSRALAKQQIELHSQHLSHQQALHNQAHNAQQEVEKLLRVQMQSEQAIAEKLETVLAQSAQDSKELMRALAEQQTSLLNQHIAHEQARQQHELALTNKLEENALLRSACTTLETQLNSEVKSGQQASLHLRQTLLELQLSLELTHASLSWRMTAPLRNLATLFIATKNQSPPPVKTSDAITTKPKIQVMSKQSPLTDGHVIDQPIKPQLERTKNLLNMPTTASTLPELLACNDKNFVECAYQALLGREPDPEGLIYYLERLRRGYSKMQIVAQLRLSNEGQAKNSQLIGLDTAIKRYQKEQLPLIGWILRLFSDKEGNRPIERKFRSIENQIFLFSDESSRRFNQLEMTLAGLQHFIIQGKQSIVVDLGGEQKDSLNPKLINPILTKEPDELKKLTPHAKNIYFQLKTAAIIYAGRSD